MRNAMPTSWTAADFRDIATPVKDKYLPRHYDEDLRCVNLENLPEGAGRIVGTSKASDNLSIKTAFKAGDVLFGKLRPYLRKYAKADFDGVCTTEIMAFRANEQVDSGFLFHVVGSKAFIDHNVAVSFGTKMPRTDWRIAGGFQARLPPLIEQRRIAAILSALDEQIEKTEALTQKTELGFMGLKTDLLSCLRLSSSQVSDVLLRQLIPSVQYGISSSLGSDGGVPVLRMNNLSGGEVDVSELKYAKVPVADDLLLRDGDVLFNRTNSLEHVGRTSIWRSQIERATFASYLVRLNPDAERITNQYLVYLLGWEVNQTQMRRYATPGVQQVNINPTNLRLCRVQVPKSLSVQCHSVEALDAYREYLTELAAEVRKLKIEKQGLLLDLLTGRVRV